MIKQPQKRFPRRFLWGASTSAHQVEGNNHNQWSVWELENARSLATRAQYHYSELENWDAIAKFAKNPGNYVSGKAVEHYERFETDFDIAASLHMNALRFSVEWSRVEPTEGGWSVEAIEHYKRYVAALKKRGLEPVVTLFHFTLPIWFVQKGGFENRTNIKYFVRFAEKILSELGGSVTYVITINEPEVYVFQGYSSGQWPPNKQSRLQSLKVLNNLAAAHNKTAIMIHGLSRRYKISVAKNSSYVYAGDDARLSMATATLKQYIQDDYFLQKVKKHCDFLGVNYYFSDRVYGYRVHNPDEKLNDMGWDMAPDHLEHTLERLYEKYKLPIIITENGVADASDEKRQWWLSHTVVAMQKALTAGVDLRGYLHRSLLDNFEWDKGRWPKFGLVEVDYVTMERRPRPSAKRYGSFMKKMQEDR